MGGARAIKISLATALLATSLTALAPDEVLFSPGRWQLTERALSVTENGRERPVSPPKGEGVVVFFRCFSGQADDSDLVANFTNPDCDWTGTAADGTIALTGQCKNTVTGPVKEVLQGTYDGQKLKFSRRLEIEVEGNSFAVTSSIDGRFVGKCKGDEEG